MLSMETLLANKRNPEIPAESLSAADIEFLVALLAHKHDEIHYCAFLTLQKRSERFCDVYPYWDTFVGMLQSKNSYHRSIGIMLIAENVCHDKENKLNEIIHEYLSHCRDEKFITCRQTIQSIARWIAIRGDLFSTVTDCLTSIEIGSFKDSQTKLILLDILKILIIINKLEGNETIEQYIASALSGGYLDQKAKKEVETWRNG